MYGYKLYNYYTTNIYIYVYEEIQWVHLPRNILSADGTWRSGWHSGQHIRWGIPRCWFYNLCNYQKPQRGNWTQHAHTNIALRWHLAFGICITEYICTYAKYVRVCINIYLEIHFWSTNDCKDTGMRRVKELMCFGIFLFVFFI